MKKLFLESILTLVALSVVSGASYAQPAQDTPESVAKAYFAALQAGDWARCASFMHTDALASIKRTLGSIISADKTDKTAKTIFGLKSGVEYAQLSEAAVFEKFMGFITGAGIVLDIKTALAASTSAILGRVDENADLTHILYRAQIKLAGAEMSEVMLISFKKHGATWRVLLTSDMDEMFTKFAEMASAMGKRFARFVEGMASASKEEEKRAQAGAKNLGRKP